MHKNQDKNFAAEKQRKREKRTRKRPKRAKPGAFRVLEGMGTVENRGERMGKPSNRAEGLVSPAGSVRPGRSPLGCRPPRHAPQAGLRAHLVAKSYRTLTKKSGIAEAMPDFFWQGQKDFGFGDRCSTNWAIPLCEILLDYSIIFQSGCQWVFKIFLRVSKNRGECCFSSHLAVFAKNTVLFGEAQPSAKEWNPLNRRSTMKKHSVSVYLSPEISGSYRKVGPNPTEIPLKSHELQWEN